MFIVRITVLVFRVEISDTVTLVLALVHAIHISPFSRCHYKIFNYRQRARVFCLENQDELSSFFALIYKFLTQKYIYFTFFITNCNYFFLKHASFSKISKVTIEFLVLWLVEMNHLSRDSYLANYYHMSLEIVLPKEVSKGDWKFFVSYSFQSPVGIILLTDEF